MLMWVSLAAYLAVMAWRLLWQAARPDVRNAQGEVQAFSPTAHDQAAWRGTQTLAQTHRQMQQQWRDMRVQVIWAVAWVLGLFVVAQLLIAATLAWVRSRSAQASSATPASSAQG